MRAAPVSLPEPRRDGEQAHRRAVPPVNLGRRWYLVAWDVSRDDWRTFRVDRIERRLSTDRRFTPRRLPQRDIGAYVAAAVSAARDRYQAEIIIHTPAGDVAKRIHPSDGALEAIDDHGCLLRTGGHWLGGLAVYVALIGVDFEVIEPPELVEQVGMLSERFLRAARRRAYVSARSMSSFDEYLATVPDAQKAELERIRQLVRRTVPDAEEATSYGMPAFKYKKRPLLGFRASKNHLSVFPFSPEAIDAARGALAGFNLSKGTVRFTPEKPIPDSALEQLLRHRSREIDAG